MGLYLNHNQNHFQIGDTIKIHQKIVEKGKERTQVFEGVVIKIKGHQKEKMFTVRKISSGIGVEKIWPIDSPFISQIEVTKKGYVRRSKLYHLRGIKGRDALKVKTRRKHESPTTKSTKPKKTPRQTRRKSSQKTATK